ncbi:MAG: Vps62-related protein [Actinomycetota bacterium]|nr:Vps62-related protein [Actinomycetota bacterium]
MVLAAAASAGYANPGSLDLAFSGDGRATTDFAGEADEASGVGVQFDGKVVAVGKAAFTSGFSGNFGVLRYRVDGELDETFAGDGRVAVDFEDFDRAEALALQTDGKIVVVGSAANSDEGYAGDFALTRLNHDGDLDTGFGDGGKRTTDFDGSDVARAVAIQSDGKIVTAGVGGAGGEYFALARYTSAGDLDPTFGTDGRVLAHVPPENGDTAYALAIQPDGKILAAGYASSTQDRWIDMALLRFNPNGVLDDSFGTEGRVKFDISAGNDQAHAVAVEPDGDIVVGGGSAPGGWQNNAFAVARFKPDGSFDTSFSGDGKQTTEMSDISDHVHAIEPQTDGKIVAIGKSGYDFVLARYTQDGALDKGFGENGDGTVLTDFGTGTNHAYAGAMANDGRIVAAGFNGSNPDFAVARYVNDGLPATPGSPPNPDDGSPPNPDDGSPPPPPPPPPPRRGEDLTSLAMRYRPWLWFDSAEHWRPLEVGSFLGEPDLQVCRNRRILSDPCEPFDGIDGLLRSQFSGSDAYIDLAEHDGAYKSPYPECRAGAVYDCDRGPRSAIYYHPLRRGSMLYLDYWWYLRYNDYPLDHHEGDWEGVTVSVSRAGGRESLHNVAFAAHNGPPWRYLALALEQTVANRVAVYLGRGTHAAYPRPCSRLRCHQTSANPLGVSPLPEARFDGGASWGNNPDVSCATCLKPFPLSSEDPPEAASWAAWDGRWGKDPGPADPLGNAPGSPGSQDRFKDPTADRPTDRTFFRRLKAAAAGGCNDSWLGPFVTAALCDDVALQRSLSSGDVESPPGFEITANQPGTAAASRPGIGQVLGDPLEIGRSLAVKGATGPRTGLVIRVADGAGVSIARVRSLGLASGGTVKLRAVRGRAGAPPMLHVRGPGRRTRTVRTGRVPLGGPLQLRARRTVNGARVTFAAPGGVTARVVLARSRRGPAIARRALNVNRGAPLRRVSARLRTSRAARFARVRVESAGRMSKWVVVRVR